MSQFWTLSVARGLLNFLKQKVICNITHQWFTAIVESSNAKFVEKDLKQKSLWKRILRLIMTQEISSVWFAERNLQQKRLWNTLSCPQRAQRLQMHGLREKLQKKIEFRETFAKSRGQKRIWVQSLREILQCEISFVQSPATLPSNNERLQVHSVRKIVQIQSWTQNTLDCSQPNQKTLNVQNVANHLKESLSYEVISKLIFQFKEKCKSSFNK
jgi:hypothetical protein